MEDAAAHRRRPREVVRRPGSERLRRRRLRGDAALFEHERDVQRDRNFTEVVRAADEN